MNKNLSRLLCFALCLSVLSCQKDNDDTNNTDPNSSTTFTAKVNGALTTFTVQASTLFRDTDFDEKRLDITGLSGDGKLRLTLTTSEAPAAGNNVALKDYPVTVFNYDDPSTAEDESLIISDAFFTLGIASGLNFIHDVYAENGHIIFTNNTANGTTGTLSGSFNGTLESRQNGSNYTLTEGSFTNLKYTVIN